VSDLAIGAALALLGVLVAQLVSMIQARLERQNKREILLRTKYEELGQHFLSSTEMPGHLLKCTCHAEILEVTHQSAANNAQLLALIYFPPLRKPIERYVSSYGNLCLVATNLYYQQPEGKMVGEVIYNNPDYQVAKMAHITDREDLATQIESHAATYAKS